MLGAAVVLEPEKTIALALELHPRARRLVVITGTAAFDRAWERTARSAFEPFRARIAIDYWSGLPTAEILQRLPGLSRNDIVFLPRFRQDGSGQRFGPQQSAAEVVAASPAPVYGASSNFREDGTIGGYVAPLEDGARLAAGLVARLIRGAKPESLAPVPTVPNRYAP